MEVVYLNSKILTEMTEKRKSYGDKRGLGYISKFETFTSRKTEESSFLGNLPISKSLNAQYVRYRLTYFC